MDSGTGTFTQALLYGQSTGSALKDNALTIAKFAWTALSLTAMATRMLLVIAPFVVPVWLVTWLPAFFMVSCLVNIAFLAAQYLDPSKPKPSLLRAVSTIGFMGLSLWAYGGAEPTENLMRGFWYFLRDQMLPIAGIAWNTVGGSKNLGKAFFDKTLPKTSRYFVGVLGAARLMLSVYGGGTLAFHTLGSLSGNFQDTRTISIDYVDDDRPDQGISPLMGDGSHQHTTSLMGRRLDPFTHGHFENHPGIDVGGEQGSTVHFTYPSGRVVFAGDAHNGFGNTVIVREFYNDREVYVVYAELGTIDPGIHQNVLLSGSYYQHPYGTPIGTLGVSGHSTGPHVHIGVWEGKEPTDGHFYPQDGHWSDPGSYPNLRAIIPPVQDSHYSGARPMRDHTGHNPASLHAR